MAKAEDRTLQGRPLNGVAIAVAAVVASGGLEIAAQTALIQAGADVQIDVGPAALSAPPPRG